MTLHDWMWASDKEAVEVAGILGVSRQAVHQWLSGATRPSAAVLAKIEDMTDGAVTARDFVEVRDARGE